MDYLLAAIRRVADGQVIAASMRAQAPHLELSQREREIFDAMLSGKALKVIALDLELSASTVHTYARRIRGKLGAETNADVVRYAHAAGLITSPR